MARSINVGIPNGRRLPLALGMYTRRTGEGSVVIALSASQTAIAARDWSSNTTTPSTPAVWRPVFFCVTLRTVTSTLAHDRSIRRCRLRTRLGFASFAAVKIRCLNARTSASIWGQLISAHQSKLSPTDLFAIASNILRSSLRISVFLPRLTRLTSARFRVRTSSPVSRWFSPSDRRRSSLIPCVSQYLSISWRLLLEPSCSRRTHQHPLQDSPPVPPACDGVSVFHTFQLQSGRVPPFPRERWCPHTRFARRGCHLSESHRRVPETPDTCHKGA